MSELRQNGFSQTNINHLNTTDYKMPPSGEFDINVFGAWFRSPSNQNVASGTIAVELEKGKIPPGFFAKLTDVLPDLYLVVGSLDPRSAAQKPNVNEVCQGRRILGEQRHDIPSHPGRRVYHRAEQAHLHGCPTFCRPDLHARRGTPTATWT